MKQATMKLGTFTCALALVGCALVSCEPASSALDGAQQENRSYMSQVNGLMEDLGTDLDSFVDAVSRGDLVNMRTQADNAYKALDDLSELEAPDDLSDVKQGYVDGTAKLRESLDGYIKLFTEVSSGSFDQSTYDDRLAQVQTLYDEGVDLLKKADETAASK